MDVELELCEVAFPREELLGVEARAQIAAAMASAGYPAEGYSSLMTGLSRAMALTNAGEPWGPDLVAQYRRTADEFAARYVVARE